MRTAPRLALALGVCALTFAACTPADDDAAVDGGAIDSTATAEPTPADEAAARAQLAELDSSGVSGEITFTPGEGGLMVGVRLAGLTPGTHGIHVHANPSCADGPDGTPGGAAGDHFAPSGSPHGAPSDAAGDRHAGDFGNVTANADGLVDTTFTDAVAQLDGDAGLVNHAVVIHGGTDDLETQPSGDSGARVACGVVAATGDDAATDDAMAP